MSNKLKNIKAVKEMIAGSHKTQTKSNVGFSDTGYTKREIDEIWEDSDGNKWQQKAGYKIKVGKLSEKRKENRMFPNCNKETCTTTNPGTADLKMKALYGMCLDCTVNYEHELKMKGEYAEYERKKMLQNGKEWLKNAEMEKNILLSTIKSQFINEDGSIEEWDGMNAEEIEKQIEEGFDKFKNGFLKELQDKEI